MPKKESTLINAILFSVYAAGGVLEMFIENSSPYRWRSWAIHGKDYKSYRSSVYNSRRRGLLEIENKSGKKFIKLTKKGQLEVLLAKAKMPREKNWDGKWRLIIFDIPENAKHHRDQLRDLLKKNDFRKLQASVYVNPYALNREAVQYLQETGLNEFIRILKVEEMDNDKDLKKKFNLK